MDEVSSYVRLGRPFILRQSRDSVFNPTLYDTQMVTALGGVPIKVGNETIGAIGVSGAPGGDKDEACANAGIAKISDRLN
jgi:uncharacterized protein GlcG (DUF336 family)